MNSDPDYVPAPPPPFCYLHKMQLVKCGCMPTDDGLEQQESKDRPTGDE